MTGSGTGIPGVIGAFVFDHNEPCRVVERKRLWGEQTAPVGLPTWGKGGRATAGKVVPLEKGDLRMPAWVAFICTTLLIMGGQTTGAHVRKGQRIPWARVVPGVVISRCASWFDASWLIGCEMLWRRLPAALLG